MNGNRVIAIGLEMVEPTLLEKWCKDGHLPTLAALRERGAYRRMFSPTEISSSSPWPSINCGVTPGKHGMAFIHRQFVSGTYETKRKRADEIGRPQFWEGFKEANKRVFTFDVPDSRIYGLDGVEIVGWGLEYKTWAVDSNPKRLINSIFKEYGKHPLDGWYQTKESTAEAWIDLKEKLLWATRTRTEIIKKILTEQDFDFTLVVYGETHFAGHLFWHINDSSHPEYSTEMEKAVGHPILEVYQECDRGTQQIIETNPEATVFIISNTGVGPNYSGRHFVGEILSRLGYRGKKNHDQTRKKNWLPAGDVFAVQRIEKMLGQRNIEKVKACIPEKIWDKVTRKFLNMGSDWKDSLAFDIPGDNSGTIRINLKGREPNGKVPPENYDDLCNKIAEEFMELKNPDNGKSIVSEVVFPHKKYPGDHVQDLPDIVIKWVDEEFIRAMESPKIGKVEIDSLPDARTGAHKDFGFLLAAGKGIRHVDGEKNSLRQAYSEDIAPTILKYMGLPVPADMDGKPLDDILEDSGVNT
ncbi:MAG: alkaline phosphatase family protein [Deltaproteobacteria bacterium]|jgi:predicted AlkP superfamily phosphohydrolase/phosphomutase|nr:alkaline phosphatase family protein [Deltaproteobacteria bacterium]